MLSVSLFPLRHQTWASAMGKHVSGCSGTLYVDKLIMTAILRIHDGLAEKQLLLQHSCSALDTCSGLLNKKDKEELQRQTRSLLEQVNRIRANYYLQRYSLEKADAESSPTPSTDYASTVKRWTGYSPSSKGGMGLMGRGARRSSPNKKPTRACTGCQSKGRCRATPFGDVVCGGCGLVQQMPRESTGSFDDVQRLTVSKKYTYERKTHFKDAMLQYQGTQTDRVPEELYVKLETHLRMCGLLNDAAVDKADRYARVNRPHVWRFLQSTGNTDYNEDCTLIWAKISGKRPPNISDIEQGLYEDFLVFNGEYEKIPASMKRGRKNMINAQYLLAQFLYKRDRRVSSSDLSIMKTHDKIVEHDIICKPLFHRLRWKFTRLSKVFTGM